MYFVIATISSHLRTESKSQTISWEASKLHQGKYTLAHNFISNMKQNIHSMNNKHVYLRNTECVGNDVKEVNDILSQIYIK